MKKDIEKLENIQHRATRLVPNLRKKGYEFRLKKLRLTTLEKDEKGRILYNSIKFKWVTTI